MVIPILSFIFRASSAPRFVSVFPAFALHQPVYIRRPSTFVIRLAHHSKVATL